MKKSSNLIKSGSIIKLGDHRLLCGSSTDQAMISKLCKATEVNAIICDPPFGVAVTESKRDLQPLNKDKVILNDHLQSDIEYATFSKKWLSAIKPHLTRKNSVYIFNADKMVFALRQAMLAEGFKLSQLLIWVKTHSIIGRLDYLPQHELIVYGWHGVHEFKKAKDKSVLIYPKPNKSKMHPTTKPLALIRRLIMNSTDIGDVIFDGFLGSGTTLLACEQTKRVCYGCEIDLEYCEVIVKRWEKLTGKKAVYE